MNALNWLLSKAEFEQLVNGATILEQQSFGVKVYLLQDQRVIKLFRIKHIISGSFVYPYSFRFAKNARRLNSLGIPSVEVERVFYCHSLRNHGVIYPLLQGKTYNQVLQTGDQETQLGTLAEFIADLHAKGVYFRSLHLGNVLQLEDGRLGLIDVGDMQLHHRPLNAWKRARNFRHLFRSADHGDAIRNYGYRPFVELYLRAIEAQGMDSAKIRTRLLAAEPGQR